MGMNVSGTSNGVRISAPTLAASVANAAAALPPVGELFAPWDGPAARVVMAVSAAALVCVATLLAASTAAAWSNSRRLLVGILPPRDDPARVGPGDCSSQAGRCVTTIASSEA